MPISFIISPMVSGRPEIPTQDPRIKCELCSVGFWAIVLGYELAVENLKGTVMANGNCIPSAVFIDDTRVTWVSVSIS